MKAKEILAVWDRSKGLFSHQPSTWLRLLRIAAAGSAGRVKTDLWVNRDDGIARLLRKWETAGLVTLEWALRAHPKGGRSTRVIKATPKLYRLLEGLEEKP